MRAVKKIYNPFEVYQAHKLLLLGSLTLIMGALLGYLCHARFDGIIDVHFSDKVELWQPFIDNIINLFSFFLVFLLIGKFINRKTRIIDVLALGMIVRMPIYLIVLTNINNLTLRAVEKFELLAQNSGASMDAGAFAMVIVFALFGILCIVYFGVLSYNGFKTIANAKGRNAIIGVVVGIILAEAISKFMFYSLF